MELLSLRQKINKIDLKILILLNERAVVVKDVGKIKRGKKLPVYNAQREMEVLQIVQKNNQGPMSNESIENIFKMIIFECRKMQTEFLMSEEE